MKKTFEVKPGPHAPQLAIQRDDLTLEECEYVRGVVCNNYMPSEDYRLGTAAGVFLQGYQPPSLFSAGWVLVEFWTDDRKAIDAFVKHLNEGM